MVRAYLPQRMSGSISANSNYTPQGGQMLAPQFDSMEYESGEIMGYEPNDWFDILWQKKIPLTINAGQVPSTQTNFPLLINDIYPDLIGEEEGELRFTGANNVQLDYEIQEFNNTTGKLIVWFKKPTVSDGDAINIYFDNPAAVNEQNSVAVWGVEFANVFHMSDVGSPIVDSTINANNGFLFGNTTTQDPGGKIGNTVNFPGGAGDLVVLDSGASDLPTGFSPRTVSAWMLTRNIGIGSRTGYSYGCVDPNGAIFLGQEEPVGTLVCGGFGAAANNITAPNIFTDTNYHYITLTYDGTTARIYENGILLNTEAHAWDTRMEGASIGRQVDSTGEWNGFVDELHVVNVVRDIDWIKTEFNNQTDPTTFYSTGTVESTPTSDVMGYEE